MAKRRRPKHETRYQRTQRFIEQGQCGLLPLDFSISCPKRNGPEQPHPEYPGKVGFLIGGWPRPSRPGKNDR